MVGDLGCRRRLMIRVGRGIGFKVGLLVGIIRGFSIRLLLV